MKKLFSLLFLVVIWVSLKAQTTQNTTLVDLRTNGIVKGALTIARTGVLIFPVRDSNFIASQPGIVIVLPSDSAEADGLVYISTGLQTSPGLHWVLLGSSTAGATWGVNITGSISAQTDLQLEFNTKQNVLPGGTSAQYWDATGALQNFPTIPAQLNLTVPNGGNLVIGGTYPNLTIVNGLTNLNQLANGPGYLTSNQSISLSGDASGSGTTSIDVVLTSVTTASSCTLCTISYDGKGRVLSSSSGTGSSPVTSVFGRTGAIVAVSGDYTAAQITNALSSASSYTNPSWLVSIPWTKITNTPTTIAGYGITDNLVNTFNTRSGAVILTSSDVTGALTYTPPPNSLTLTINGVTQSLTANRTWTLSTDSGIAMTSVILSGASMKLLAQLPRVIEYDTTEGANPEALVTQNNLQRRLDSVISIPFTLTVNRGLHPVANNRFVLGDLPGIAWDSAVYLNASNYASTLAHAFTFDSLGRGWYLNGLNPAVTGATFLVRNTDSSVAQLGLGTGLAISGGNIVVTSGGLTSFTSPGNTISIGGSLTAPTVDINLSHANTWSGGQTFSGGVDMSSNFSFNADNTYFIGSTSNAAADIYTYQVNNSNGNINFHVPNGNGYLFYINGTEQMGLSGNTLTVPNITATGIGYSAGGSAYEALIQDTITGIFYHQVYYPYDSTGYASGLNNVLFNGSKFYLGAQGVATDVVANYSSGSTYTVPNGTNILVISPTSVVPSLTITLPTTWHSSNALVIVFAVNSTITSGNTMVNSITVVNGSGQTLSEYLNPNGLPGIAGMIINYHLIGTIDQRFD